MTANDPTFPPLLTGEEAPAGADPFDKAVAAALTGCDAGLLVWSRRADALSAAVVLAPECPLEQAIGISFAVSVGLVDEGLAPLHAAWRERAWEMGEALPDGSGTFMGLDELGGMLVKSEDGTIGRPLTDLLERS